MKIHTILFVLILGLSVTNRLSAQTPDPTPTLTQVTAFVNVPNASNLRLDSGKLIEYQFYIFASDFAVPATDVVLTVILPVQVGYMYAEGANCSNTNANGDGREPTTLTCSLGTVLRHPIDYSKFFRIYAFPQIAGQVTITGTIKGSNTAGYSFTNTSIILPEKSRKRIRFL